jgi:hypothetical protein
MRILIAIVLGVVAGVGVRLLMNPTVKEITAPAPSYSETHAETVKLAEEKAAINPEKAAPLNPAYTEPLQVRGYITRNTRVNVVLSDGTTWTEKTGGLEHMERSHVVFRGKLYAIVGAGAAPVRPEAVESTQTKPAKILDAVPGMGATRAPSGEPAPLQQPALSSWVTDADGVSRLRVRETLNTGPGR